ncbi:MAG: TraV family lipoprotein [Betaproteobacteria bacterium]
MRTVGWATSICVAIALTGCASFSGLDASSQFSCKAPDGVLCQSMSGVYANAEAHNLPGQRATREAGSTGSQAATAAPAVVSAGGVLTKPIYSGTPIRTAPVVLRVWLAPWEDNDGDLHDQSYIYVPVDGGRWLIEHNRRRIQDAYRPVRAPVAAAQAAPPSTARSAVDAEPASAEPGPPAIPQSAADVLNGLLRPAAPAGPPSLN